MDVLVVNVGSSTVKVQVVDGAGRRTFDEEIEGGPSAALLDEVIDRAGDVGAVGHRLVHGGADHVAPAAVTDDLLARLDELAPLAPLHLPPALAVVRTVRRIRPDLPAVACFDTAFHATMAPEAWRYAVPEEWAEAGLRRYGFHGLSHAHVARRAAELVGRPVEELRTVSCHLGAGASLAAIDGGRSVDTTMGFTPMSGLVMATRPGDLDPAAILWLLRRGLTVDDVEDALWHGSGLAGLAGTSGDMRELVAGAEAGDERATMALAAYMHRARASVAAMAAALGGLDVIAFTGGVGEHSGRVRDDIVGGLGFLGASLDRAAPPVPSGGDAVVSPAGSAVAVVVVHAREDLEIARQVRTVV